MPRSFDAILIGTGQANPALAARLDAAGMKVAVIERNKFGGTCVNTGCMPTKTMVASAYAAHMARRAADYGVAIGGDIRVDMRRVHERAQAVAHTSSGNVEKWMRGLKHGQVFHGHGRFLSANTVAVGDQQLTAPQIFIDVGGRAQVPTLPGLERLLHLTNSSIMQVDYLPEHLLIVGGSYVGLEFAQMFRRFGSQVTVIDRGPTLLPREDPDVSKAVRDILTAEGITIESAADCLALEGEPGRITVTASCGSSQRRFTGSHLLLAAGREPNTADLGLEAAGVQLDKRGFIQVDEQCRSSIPGIWALGECNGRGAFTHTAYNDYEIVAATVFNETPRRLSDRTPCYALFIDPPLARIGLTETEAKKQGHRLLVGTRPMTRVGRAVERGETLGFIKIIVDADNEKILGASILGIGGDEAIHCLLDTMYAGASYQTVARAVHIHPTVSELLPTVLQDLHPV